MAKEKEIKEVSVTKVESEKSVVVRVAQLPRKNEVGVYFTPKLNQIGIAVLQTKFPEAVDQESFEELLSKTFGIPPEGFGSLGVWKTPEDKSKWAIKVNGTVYNPTVVEQANPVPSPIPAQPNISAEEHNVKVILDALSKYDEAMVAKQVTDKFGMEVGTHLISKAKKLSEQPAATLVPKVEFVF